MADNTSTSTASPATGSKVGGARVAGIRSSATQDSMNKDEEFIKKIWNVQAVQDVFPIAIKPTTIAYSTMNKLRGIATREKNLAAVQAILLNVCKNASGDHVPFAHKHAVSVLDTLKSAEASTPKRKPDAENVAPKSTTKKTVASGSHATPAHKRFGLVAPVVGVLGPFSIGKVQPKLVAPEVVMVSGQVKKDIDEKYQVPRPVFTITKKRVLSTNNNAPAKKPRKEDDPENMSIVEPKSMIQPIGVIQDTLEAKMAELKRANAAFFAGSEARQAVFTTDTIRVAHPQDPKSFVEFEQSKAPAPSVDHASILNYQPQDWLKLHCLGLHDSVRIILPSATSLQKMARPEQRPLVEQAVRVIDQAVAKLKTDMESVFADV